MKHNKLKKYFFIVCGLFLLASCAPKVTFYVTKPAEFQLENIESIALGNFEDAMGADINVAKSGKAQSRAWKADLKPEVSKFVSNEKAANLVKGMVAAGISSSGQYGILTDEDYAGVSGVIPNPKKVAVINAKVKYYEFTAENFEKNFYLLLATKGGLSIKDKLLLEAGKAAVVYVAEKNKTGFVINAPYTEKIGAMEVEFDLVGQSDAQKITPVQKFNAFFIKKWGGKDADTSHLAPILKKVVLDRYKNTDLLFSIMETQTENIASVMFGGDNSWADRLENNPAAPLNSLGVKIFLARQIVGQYLKKISRHTVKANLKIESGDDVAVNFIRGNAYEKAINRLENLKRGEEDSFNLGLAYEAMGEYSQALRYYQEALDKSSGNKTYKAAVKRVKRH